MTGLGTIVNFIAIIAGGAVGLLLRKVMSKRVTDTVLQGMGLAVVIVGISGALSASFVVMDGRNVTEHILFMIIALAIGAIIGELIKIEDKLEAFGKICERKLSKPGEASTFAQGFVTATLVFCVGSMAVVGSIEDGINQNSEVLFAKSAIDAVTAMAFASTMGIGVLFSAVSVGLYQGTITLLSFILAPYLEDFIIRQISLIGCVLIMAIGLNLLQVAKIKVGNMLPAMLVPVVYHVVRLLVLSF